MDTELIYRVSSIIAISSAVIAALFGGIQWWSGNVISSKQEIKIVAMEKDTRVKRSTIFSQKIISQNIPDGKLFVQKYQVSINSPVVHVPLYTYIQSRPINGIVERVGEMQINDVGGGVRSVGGVDVSYVDTEYTLKTNRALDEGESITFTLEKRPDVAM